MPNFDNFTSGWEESSHSLADEEADKQIIGQVVEHGESLLRKFPAMAVPYIAGSSIAIVIGVIGNSIILVAQLLKKRVRTKGFEFQANMALADLLVSAIAEPLCIVAAVCGPEVFAERGWLCKMVGSLCFTACICSFLSLIALTLNIYTYICHYPVYIKIFTRKKNIALCGFIWIAAFGLDLPNFIDEGHGYDHHAHQCMWQKTNNPVFTGFVAIFLLLIPCVMMDLAFGWIFFTVYQSKSAVQPFEEGNNAGSRKKLMKKTLKRCKGTFPIVIAFTICWTPYAISLLADMDNNWPFWTHLWITFLAHLHSVAMIFTLTFTNEKYREAFREIICLKKDNVISVTTGQTTTTQSKTLKMQAMHELTTVQM